MLQVNRIENVKFMEDGEYAFICSINTVQGVKVTSRAILPKLTGKWLDMTCAVDITYYIIFRIRIIYVTRCITRNT